MPKESADNAAAAAEATVEEKIEEEKWVVDDLWSNVEKLAPLVDSLDDEGEDESKRKETIARVKESMAALKMFVTHTPSPALDFAREIFPKLEEVVQSMCDGTQQENAQNDVTDDVKEEENEQEDEEGEDGEEEEEEEEEETPFQAILGEMLAETREREKTLRYPPEKRVPVVVLTGFLGSGKTTLLNRILKEKHGKKIAVIENEFGEIGIDDSLVKEQVDSKEEIFEMNNGCLCCTVRGDLVKIFQRLMKRKDKFDYVVIETTGLADPAPIVQTFFIDEKVGLQMRLDGIVTVADAKHIVQHLDEVKPEGAENEAVEQIAFADRIVLNKTDLVSAEQLSQVMDKIKSINSNAKVIPAKHADVPIADILDIKAFDLERVLEMEPDFLDGDDEHHHDSNVGSVGITLDAELDIEKMNDWLMTFLQARGKDVYRMKGVVALKGVPMKWVFQGVHQTLDSNPLTEWLPNEKRTSKMVFIGKNLDRKELNDAVIACIAK